MSDTNNEQGLPATAEDMKGIDWNQLNIWMKEAEERDKRLRKIYLENPDRRSVKPFDIVELIWFHSVEYYGKALDDEGVQTVLDIMTDDSDLSNLIYDAVSEYADRKGWKMII